MTDALTVPVGERGVVRVFSVLIEAGDLRALRTPGAIDRALGVTGVEGDHIELFPISDLAGVGLATYLVDGCGIPQEAVDPDMDRLDAVSGVVMVVLSRAFGGQAARIEPAAQLDLIAAYSETPVDWTSRGSIETASARPRPDPGPAKPSPRATRARARRAGATAFAIFIALIALIVLVVVR